MLCRPWSADWGSTGGFLVFCSSISCWSCCRVFIFISPHCWFLIYMSRLMTKPTKWLCAQWRLRSAWASVLSDQNTFKDIFVSIYPTLSKREGSVGRYFYVLPQNSKIWERAAVWQNQQNDLCVQRRLISDWASAPSNQTLRCPHEETVGP